MGMIDFKLGDVGELFTNIREAVTGEKIVDSAKMAEIAAGLDELESKLVLGQQVINEAEASNPHVFVAGWRPFIGWVGGMAMAYQYLFYPLILWTWVALGNDLTKAPPVINASDLYPIILGMLGIGGMRSFDKMKGTDTRSMRK